MRARSAKSVSAKTRASGTTGTPLPAEGWKKKKQKLMTHNSDEYCPHCDNHFVIEAKTPQAALRVEGEDIRKDSRFVPYLPPSGLLPCSMGFRGCCAVLIVARWWCRMIKDDRIKGDRQRGLLGLGDDGDMADRLG